MQLLTMKELMAFLKVKRNTVYELRRQGLPVIHLGRSVRFDLEEVVAWVRSNQSREQAPSTPPDVDKASLALEAANAETLRNVDFLL